MRSLCQYRADVDIRRAPLPAGVRRALLALGCRTYADVLVLDDAPPEALAWARDKDMSERVQRAREDVVRANAWRVGHT